MQCPNCQFENMPGNAACVRCGASLVLASQVISIHPPRASTLVKHLRSWLPFLPYYYRMRDRWAIVDVRLPFWLRDAFRIAPLRYGTWLRMIVPGWAHWYQGQAGRGLYFFTAWIAMAILCALTIGSSFSAIVAGVMLAAHAGSIVDLAWRSRDIEDQRTMIAAVLLWTAAACIVVVALYMPVRQAVLARIDARQWLDDEPPFAAGDVVLFRPVAAGIPAPQVGDVVLYNRGGYTVQQEYHRVVRRMEVLGMDRILAGPNTTVRWRRGELTIDGRASPLKPLNPARVPANFDLQVPTGYVCILPSGDALLTASGSLDQWTQQSLVRQDVILGRAIVRNYPFWRLWWIQ